MIIDSKNSTILDKVFEFEDGIYIGSPIDSSSLQLVKISTDSNTYEIDGIFSEIIQSIDGHHNLMVHLLLLAQKYNIDSKELISEAETLFDFLLNENIIRAKSIL